MRRPRVRRRGLPAARRPRGLGHCHPREHVPRVRCSPRRIGGAVSAAPSLVVVRRPQRARRRRRRVERRRRSDGAGGAGERRRRRSEDAGGAGERRRRRSDGAGSVEERRRQSKNVNVCEPLRAKQEQLLRPPRLGEELLEGRLDGPQLVLAVREPARVAAAAPPAGVKVAELRLVKLLAATDAACRLLSAFGQAHPAQAGCAPWRLSFAGVRGCAPGWLLLLLAVLSPSSCSSACGV